MAQAVNVLLFVGLGLVAVLLATILIPRANRVFTRVCLDIFRDTVEQSGRRREERNRLLQSIHATSTYPVYASKTIMYAGIVAIAASLVSTAVVFYGIRAATSAKVSIVQSIPPELHFLIPSGIGAVGTQEFFVVFVVSSGIFGTLGGWLTYSFRWWLVGARADQRRVLIDESVARTIAFIYALSRSGMVFPQIMRTVGRNRKAFGQSAEEIGVVVKDMDLFGADLGTALERIAHRTPSEQFGDFAENFASVLQSGQNVSAYLRDQYDQYQEERIANQERLLELFTALGEGYVAGLVAGPLFLITILLIFGILTGGLLDILQFAIYGLIPLANLGFIGYINSISEPLSSYQAPVHQDVASRPLNVRRAETIGGGVETDGGTTLAYREREMNRIRLRAFNRFRRFYQGLFNPFETVVSKPTLLLYVTGPLAVGAVAIRLWMLDQSGALSIGTADDVVIQSTLFLFATYAIVQEVRTRRLREIEAAVPDLLERLANTNEAGMTFTESLQRIDRSDLGVLNVEVERLLSDIRWGARTEKALYRFNERIGSSTVARVVALLTNAMAASGNLAPVIRIAADEAREDRRLRRSRRQELFMYVIIIYLAFFIFLGIGVALQLILIPAIPSGEELSGIAQGPGGVGVNLPINPVQGSGKEAYTLLLYHAAIVQSACSGLVAGQMGEGSVANGAKHVALMLLSAYGVFLLFA
ncbi:MAG TPA: type II secretion system F family protein [Halobacteriales archaeon]|nr:type II secretion system F family protein [Halobacteriales archaeon]